MIWLTVLRGLGEVYGFWKMYWTGRVTLEPDPA